MTMAEPIGSPSRSIPLEGQIVQNVILVIFTTAILATILWPAIRFRYQNRLFADDYVLLFGCCSLIAFFTLTNVMNEVVYFDMSLILGPVDLLL